MIPNALPVLFLIAALWMAATVGFLIGRAGGWTDDDDSERLGQAVKDIVDEWNGDA